MNSRNRKVKSDSDLGQDIGNGRHMTEAEYERARAESIERRKQQIGATLAVLMPATAFQIEQAELANTVIRILDFPGRHNLRLGEAIQAKLLFNLSRPYKHGKKY